MNDDFHLHNPEKAMAISVACILLNLNPSPVLRQEMIHLIETARDAIDTADAMRRASPGEEIMSAIDMLRARRASRKSISDHRSTSRETELQQLALDMAREDRLRTATNTRDATVAVSAGAMSDLMAAIEKGDLTAAKTAIVEIKASTKIL